MKNFINELLVRYRQALETSTDSDQTRELRERLNSLRLAHSVLIKIELNNAVPKHLPQIAILGPTQAGKSTLVNLIAAKEIAGASPLAGYTVHAQGFTSSGDDHEIDAISPLFEKFERLSADKLSADNLECYSLEAIGDRFSPLPQLMLWDSPDFDSIESKGYRSSVLRVTALSDIIILMVSKDKYADKAVWDMLSLIRPLNKPIIVCINKLSDEDSDVVTSSFSSRYEERCGKPIPPIVSIPFNRDVENAQSSLAETIRASLIDQISLALETVRRDQQEQWAYQFIDQHWDAWLEPALNERAAKERWKLEVNAALEDGMQRYRDGYLDHPQKYDTFNRAIAELLTLLEIPGIAGALGKTRKVVTWPVRKLFNLGQNVLERDSREPIVPTELEDDVLLTAHAHIVTRLTNVAFDMQQERDDQLHWWTMLAQSLRTSRPSAVTQVQQAIDSYQLSFVPEIEEAAQKLYDSLQNQPTLLNTLRVARVSTDATAVVLAVKSGGLAASDLVLAPAMLSLTTMLTEGVLGKYMNSVKADLKSRQATIVRELVFEQVIKDYLYQLPETLRGNSLFNLDEEQILNAQNKLKAAL